MSFFMATVIIGAGRPSSCQDQNKQEDVRRCLPSRKHLLLTFLTPTYHPAPRFELKERSPLALSFPSLSFLLPVQQPAAQSHHGLCSFHPFVAMQSIMSRFYRYVSPSIVYTLLGSLHTLSVAITGASAGAAGCYQLRHAGLICVFPPQAASITLMWKQSLSDFVSKIKVLDSTRSEKD